MTAIPRSIRDVSPGDGFEKITNNRPDGLPDGLHTGGAWTNEIEVWKGLDGGNAHDGPHYPTLEAECLEEMAGEPCFPRNWRIEERNGRRWLVRKVAPVFGQTAPYSYLKRDDVLTIENGLKALNARGWEVGDEVSVAQDPDTYEPFLVDLSCASRAYTHWLSDDEIRFHKFLEEAGFDRLLELRQRGRKVLGDPLINENDVPKGWRWVYASYSRPVSKTWADKVRHLHLVHDASHRPHTWIVAPGPIDDAVLFSYELTLAWSPWDTPAKDNLKKQRRTTDDQD